MKSESKRSEAGKTKSPKKAESGSKGKNIKNRKLAFVMEKLKSAGNRNSRKNRHGEHRKWCGKCLKNNCGKSGLLLLPIVLGLLLIIGIVVNNHSTCGGSYI
ncbi:MAG: hypothetical protein ACLUR5_16810 [Eubacterium ventriosum]